MPASALNSSQLMWLNAPTPDDAIFTVPGFAFASAITS
jgi:hypothetical protein